jgi:hypothetical protein
MVESCFANKSFGFSIVLYAKHYKTKDEVNLIVFSLRLVNPTIGDDAHGMC